MDLHAAALKGDLSALQAAINKGENVDSVDENGCTPLHLAAQNGHTDCVRALLLSGATLDLPDEHGETALMMAKKSPLSNPRLVKLLEEWSELQAPQSNKMTLPTDSKNAEDNVKRREIQDDTTNMISISSPPEYPLLQTPSAVRVLPPGWKATEDVKTKQTVFENQSNNPSLPHPPGYPLLQTPTHPGVTFYDEPVEKQFTSSGGQDRSSEEADKLSSLEASSSPTRSSDSEPVYRYKEVPKDKAHFSPRENKGKLKLVTSLIKVRRKFRGPERPPPHPNLYTVRVYRTPTYTTGDRIVIIAISLYGRLYDKLSEVLDTVVIPRDYPEVSRQVSDKTIWISLTFVEMYATLSIQPVQGWSVEPDKDMISHYEVDCLDVVKFKAEELHDYPPRIVCRFLPKENAPECTTATLSLSGLQPPVSIHVPLIAPSTPQVVIMDTTKLQEATDELRRFALRVRDIQLGSTVNSLVSLMERMTAALRSSSLSEITGHTESIQTEIVSVLGVARKVAEECTIQSISDNIEDSVSKITALSHQLCHVIRDRLRYCQDQFEERAALDDLVENGANLLKSVDCLLTDVNAISEISGSNTGYNVLVRCREKIVQSLSNDPRAIALVLLSVGLISEHVLEMINELSETRREKATRLYTALVGVVKQHPHKYHEFVSTLRPHPVHTDLVTELDDGFNTIATELISENDRLKDVKIISNSFSQLDKNPSDTSITILKNEDDPLKDVKEISNSQLDENPSTDKEHQYIQALKSLVTAKQTKNIRTMKVFLLGPPSVGKSTTLCRLQCNFTNISSLEGEEAICQSTLLANCTQVLSLVNKDALEWKCARNSQDEVRLLFQYLNGIKNGNSLKTESRNGSSPKPIVDDNLPESYQTEEAEVQEELSRRSLPTKHEVDYDNNIIIKRILSILQSCDQDQLFEMFQDATLLNINDIGGQPGFLEMLPALSNGPAMYLVFLNASKELDKYYDIPFSRGNVEIQPFSSSHTVEDAISQILSSIATVHTIAQDSTIQALQAINPEKIESYLQVTPTATLIGTHKDKLEEPVDESLQQVRKALNNITQKYKEIITKPSFFAVDNLNGTEETDIGDLRKFISSLFRTHFKDSSLPIKPQWLILSMLMRLEYHIVPIEKCYEIGVRLSISQEEVNFCLKYLHGCVGTIMYYPEIGDEWFDKHIICSVQVVFDSISQFILTSLHTLHSGTGTIQGEHEGWIKKGQFSLESIKKYCAESAKIKCENKEIVPAKPLIHLLKYVHLISPLFYSELSDSMIYFMPAVLDCALLQELISPPQPDANNPQPLHITFSFKFVPTGVFCGLITELVFRGRSEILGLTWKLVEEGVQRNLVSFLVANTNKVTLLAHAQSYEIRVVRNNLQISLHDLCTYVLSVILYTLKSLYPRLAPQIAFRCPCPDHERKSIDNLCVLAKDFFILFVCNDNPVTLTTKEQVWLGKVVNVGELASLTVLKFVTLKCTEFSFEWSKVGDEDAQVCVRKPNTISFDSVRDKDIGYYQCEVKEREKVVLTLHTALYRHQTSVPLNGASAPQSFDSECADITLTVDHLMPVLDIVHKAQGKWHFIGKYLGVSFDDLNEIESKCLPCNTLRCLQEMLLRRIQRGGLTRSMLCESLRGTLVGRDDVAREIETLAGIK